MARGSRSATADAARARVPPTRLFAAEPAPADPPAAGAMFSAVMIAPITAAAVADDAPRFVLGGFWPQGFAAAPGAASGGAPRTEATSDRAIRADLARAQYGVSGAGIRVGILSDSFNRLGGMAADQARGDLPGRVTILEEGPAGSHDEGRAMADLVHRIAPDAQIMFHTATAGEADFAAGITALQQAGCTIIVDDVAYLDEPFFQDGGLVQAAVERAVAAGVSYFTAASNEGRDFVQQGFAGMRATLPGLPPGATMQNFGAGKAARPWLDLTVPTGGQLLLDLQWDQPFASIGHGHASANSLGLALYDTAGHMLAAASANVAGGNPVQVLSFRNSTAGAQFRLVLYWNGGAAPPGMFKIINYGNGDLLGGAVGHGSGAVIGHEMAPGGNTVAAVAWSASARYGGANPVEPFSSVGAGEFLFGADGARLAAPLSPAKVDFAAPDGSVTSVFAPFFGTSAAAPNAAAVAALVLQVDPWLTPAQVSAVLAQSCAPAGGGAAASGAGLIQADMAVGIALQLRAAHP